MTRQDIITLAEKLGLLYPEPTSSSDYQHPQHQRLISKLEKFADGIEKKILISTQKLNEENPEIS